jgi:hypothetical protein
MFDRSWNYAALRSTRSAVGLRVVTLIKNAPAPGATTVVGSLRIFTPRSGIKNHTRPLVF